MCNKNCFNHTYHAIFFFIILSFLLLANAPNLTFLYKLTEIVRTHTAKGGDGDAGFLSPPCTTTTTKMTLAFLYGALFTLLLTIVSNKMGSSSPKHTDYDHHRASGAHTHYGVGTSHTVSSSPTEDLGGADSGGVGFALLRTFPTFAYSVTRPPRMGRGSRVCVVCQDKLRDGEMVRWLPDCDHLFHLSCIDEWLSSHKTCPSCRADLDFTTTHMSISNGTTNATIITNYQDDIYFDYFNEYYYNVF